MSAPPSSDLAFKQVSFVSVSLSLCLCMRVCYFVCVSVSLSTGCVYVLCLRLVTSRLQHPKQKMRGDSRC